MIRLSRDPKTGFIVPSFSGQATNEEQKIANTLKGIFENALNQQSSYKNLMEALDKGLQEKSVNFAEYIDEETISQIEDIYKGTVSKWNPQTSGKSITDFDPRFYEKLDPEAKEIWESKDTAISFAGRQLPNVQTSTSYADFDAFLHARYSNPSSTLAGTAKTLTPYTEQTRNLTNEEYEILKTALLAREKDEEGKELPSAAEAAATPLVDIELEKTFGALSTDALKQVLKEYEKAKKQEQTFGILRGMGLPTTGSLKEEIKNSILGDIGTGGFLSFGKGGETKASLESQLDKALGLGNSVQYNWQKWFDETLAERYRDMETISDPDDASQQYTVAKDFANSFVEQYLRPRFDTSKSMAEFISYMDVDVENQNVLQTQLASSALKDLAQNQAKTYIDSLKSSNPGVRSFDVDFYTNPINLPGDTTRKELYKTQKESFDAAWEAWQKGDTNPVENTGKTWDILAYEYGLVDSPGDDIARDAVSKDDFAKLHYEIVGKKKGFDPVADTYTRKDLSNFIQTDLRNALSGKLETFPEKTFLEFVTADAKADEVLAKFGIGEMPEDLKQKLDEAGVDYKEYPTDELKAMLLPFLQTDPAIDIRDAIQKLNEQRIKPTQEELGFTYIQRDEDEKIEAPPGGTMLYKIFSNAGYGGNESEFYKEFFPDATEEDKNLTSTTKAGSKTGLEGLLGFSMPDMTDPFSAIASFSSMMDTEEKQPVTAKRSSYFEYFPDEEDDGAPSYFDNMETNFFGGLGSLFG